MTISKQFLLAALFAGGAALSAVAQTEYENRKPASPAEFSRDVRNALRSLVSEQVVPALKESRIPAGQGVVIPSPLYGDRDNFVRNLLKNAVTDAGRECVESQDDMWPAIMKELGFNEGFKDLMNEAMMTRINEQWPSRIMLYGWVRVERGAGRRNRGPALYLELSLHADELETRRHIWGRDFIWPLPAKPDMCFTIFVSDKEKRMTPSEIDGVIRKVIGHVEITHAKAENATSFSFVRAGLDAAEIGKLEKDLNQALQAAGLDDYWIVIGPVVPPPPPPPPRPVFDPARATSADLAVYVTARPQDDDSSDLALELLSIARETIGGHGFQVALDADKADIAVQLSVRKSLFDRTGNYAVMEGSVRAIATVPARKGFYLGETRIDRERGERKLGDRDAMLSVRDGIEPKLVSWIGQNITVEKAGLAAIQIPGEIWMLNENEAAKFISDFCSKALEIDGIARCTLAKQTDEDAIFNISYIVEKLPEGPVNAIRARHPEFFPVPEQDR